MMNALIKIFAVLLPLLSFPLSAAPQVTGFDRFHGKEPSTIGGRILFFELGCASCHDGPEHPVPRRGPSLGGLPDRLEISWVRDFLKNPEGRRKGSTMPRMVHGLGEKEVESILAYLASLPPARSLKKSVPRFANAERGSALFHEIGCVACHPASPDFRSPLGELEPNPHAVAFPDFREKTSVVGLAHFLRHVSAFRPDARMPHFDLDETDALDLAAHLIDFQGSNPRTARQLAPWPEFDDSSRALGKSLVERHNCAACHDFPGIEPRRIELKALRGGCLSDSPRPGRPFYDLTDHQLRSLEACLGEIRKKEPASTREVLVSLNCFACHSRASEGGPLPETRPFFAGDEALGDSGRIPPPLTGIGHKLKPEWMEGVFRGERGTRLRDYLRVQMPAYPAQAEVLTRHFAAADAPGKGEELVPSDDWIEPGRKLLGTQGGLQCITCHRWDGRQALGMQALDISNLADRLQPGWLHRYLLNPAEYRPGTLMPPLWPGGKSVIPDVLDGDTRKQIAAIWSFAARGEGFPGGYPDVMSGRFELIPGDRPIVQRTFLEGAGGKAILVGFPGGIHLAYDGEKGRPALVWTGRFFDAYETWFLRKAEFQQPLGEKVYPFAETEDVPARFLGYELDAGGNPTFLLSRDGRRITDHFEVREGALRRTIRWEDEGEPPLARHPEGIEVTSEPSDRRLNFIYRPQ